MPLVILSLLSAFLLFQVQPMISKFILPWFGGSPGVWTTAMLFFQLLLLAGYAYAHGLTRLALKKQLYIHGGLLVLAVCWSPFTAVQYLKPTGTEEPTTHILLLLLVTVGLHYFLLSCTSPLAQHWFSRTHPGRSPWRLYALSNVGSLGALLTYPFLIEPHWELSTQMTTWTIGFIFFALLVGYCLRQNNLTTVNQTTNSTALTIAKDAPPRLRQRLLWLGLPAFATMLLLATTNHVCTDVAVIPFLWVVPLSLYLLTFIITFDSDRWYIPWLWAALAAVAAMAASGLMHIDWEDFSSWLKSTAGFEWSFSPTYVNELVIYFGLMFLGCFVAHGELARLRPAAARLTSFYLHMSAGGALGGLLINLVAPRVFVAFTEWPLALITLLLLAAAVLWRYCARIPQQLLRYSMVALLGIAIIAGVLQMVDWEFKSHFRWNANVWHKLEWKNESEPVLEQVRNFYGTMSVEEEGEDEYKTISLIHGSIRHGSQSTAAEWREEPLNYYGGQSGIGQALAFLKDKPNAKVGVVGMGTGTVGCYAKAGHCYRFYEINPEVPRLARTHFTYLEDMERRGAKAEVILGDARLILEREPAQHFDVIILDAFSGDSIPVHLLTAEAMKIYKRHLNADGILILHITNRYVNLAPVAYAAAKLLQLKTCRVMTEAEGDYDTTDAMLLTNNSSFLSQIKENPLEQEEPEITLWTDQRSDLFSLLK
jgi:hypothetical protein